MNKYICHSDPELVEGEESHNYDLEIILSNPLFKKIQSYGLINELVLRNLQIKSEYLELRKTYSQIESIFLLSEKYHRSYDAINTILFRKRKIKPLSIF